MKELFQIAKENNILVEYVRIPDAQSCCACDGNGEIVLMDYSLVFSAAKERVHFAHELGHCVQGAFYCDDTAFDDRRRHEAKATRWAIQQLVPLAELRIAVRQEYIDEWQLAEYFCVTPEFMHAALEYWTVTRGDIL